MAIGKADLLVRVKEQGAKKAAANLNQMGASMLGLDKSSKSLASSAKNVTGGVTAVAAAAVAVGAALFKMSMEVSRQGAELGEWSQKLGIAAGDLHQLQIAGSQMGIESQDLNDALKDLNEKMVEASLGGNEYAKTFKALGVSVKDGSGSLRDTEDVLSDLADKFALLPDGAEKTTVAMRLMSDGGVRMIPFLNKGSAGIEEMGRQARATGLVMGDDFVKLSKEFHKTLDTSKQKLNSMTRAWLMDTGILEGATEALKTWIFWANNQEALEGQASQVTTNGLAIGKLRREIEDWTAAQEKIREEQKRGVEEFTRADGSVQNLTDLYNQHAASIEDAEARVLELKEANRQLRAGGGETSAAIGGIVENLRKLDELGNKPAKAVVSAFGTIESRAKTFAESLANYNREAQIQVLRMTESALAAVSKTIQESEVVTEEMLLRQLRLMRQLTEQRQAFAEQETSMASIGGRTGEQQFAEESERNAERVVQNTQTSADAIAGLARASTNTISALYTLAGDDGDTATGRFISTLGTVVTEIIAAMSAITAAATPAATTTAIATEGAAAVAGLTAFLSAVGGITAAVSSIQVADEGYIPDAVSMAMRQRRSLRITEAGEATLDRNTTKEIGYLAQAMRTGDSGRMLNARIVIDKISIGRDVVEEEIMVPLEDLALQGRSALVARR